MNRKQRARVQMFRRGQEFRAEYQSQWPAASPIGQAFDKLSTAVAAFDQDAASRQTRQREGDSKVPAARAALVFQLDAVARTAELIARTTTGFDERFVLPRPKRNDVVLAAGQGFLADAEPQAELFIAHGLPATFVADLRNAVAAFEAALRVREQGKLARANAAAGLASAEAAGMEAVDAIDVIVRYQFAQHPEMQATWARARRLDGLPAKKEAATPAPSTSSPPTASPTTTPPPAKDRVESSTHDDELANKSAA